MASVIGSHAGLDTSAPYVVERVVPRPVLKDDLVPEETRMVVDLRSLHQVWGLLQKGPCPVKLAILAD